MFIKSVIDRTIKLEMFILWYILATIYTCLTLGRKIGEMFFDGSNIPEVIGVVVMITIGWFSRSILKGLKQQASSDEQLM